MKILYVTTISLTMNSFFKPHIEMLVKDGNTVDIACNYNNLEIDRFYDELGCKSWQIDFSRSPLSLNNLKAYRQLKKVIEQGNYDVVHCHTPNASVITRLVCRKFRKQNKLKVFYTAHGFHFYKGAPKVNWLLFYPIEKICSRFTDKLITINHEDFELAKNKFKAREVCYIPGAGIDLPRFKDVIVNRKNKRHEINVPEDAFLLLSIGELNGNKNHQIIIKALSELNNPNVYYAIAGVGEKKNYLLRLANKLGVSNRIRLLGYRKDANELYHCADVFCFPTIREGLGLAAIEAMACGIPVVAADNRGTRTFVSQGVNGFLCSNSSTEDFINAINTLIDDSFLKISMSEECKNTAEKFSLDNILIELKKIYY